MEVKKRIIMKRIDGIPVNVRLLPSKGLSDAVRFNNIEEYEAFATGFYGPSDKSQYVPQEIRITYEEVNTDGLKGGCE